MSSLRGAPPLCNACSLGATACQAVGYTSCADRRRIWNQGYGAAMRHIEALTSSHTVSEIYLAANAGRNGPQP